MRDIRNSDGRLVCRIDESARVIEIGVKGCLTRIKWDADDSSGKFRVTHIPKKAA